jgi:plasmid stabilization system protein ParE
MPLINFPLLHRLVTELDLLGDGPESARRREDLHYTLCVATGVREPEQAISRARALLAARARTSMAAA